MVFKKKFIFSKFIKAGISASEREEFRIRMAGVSGQGTCTRGSNEWFRF